MPEPFYYVVIEDCYKIVTIALKGEFMLIGDIIREYRSKHNLSLQQFADKINSSKGYVFMLEKNYNSTTGKPINPSIKSLSAIAKAMNIDIEDLLKMLDNDQKILLDEKIFKEQFDSVTDVAVKVPLVGKISAGLPILATQNIEGYEFAPKGMIKEDMEYFYLRVQGDSMNMKFNDGDIVLVQKQDTLENDEIGVILVGDEATVKKFKEDNGMVILTPMSTNPEHSVQIYKDTQVKIIGKVISYQGKV